jgi:hypothetical protein
MEPCPEIVLARVGGKCTAIMTSNAKKLIEMLDGFLKWGGCHNILIICHGHFFKIGLAHLMHEFFCKMDAKDMSSDIFVFPESLICLVGLSGLYHGCPTGEAMPPLDEDDDGDLGAAV